MNPNTKKTICPYDKHKETDEYIAWLDGYLKGLNYAIKTFTTESDNHGMQGVQRKNKKD